MSGVYASIPTQYKGVQYRSRLEARYGAFFDLLGWNAHYEPCDFNGWIPDFGIESYSPPGANKQPIFVEVKPIFEFDERVSREMEQAAPVDCELLLVGSWLLEETQFDPSNLYLGWLSEVVRNEPDERERWWARAQFGYWIGDESKQKNERNLYGFAHEFGQYQDRISGAYDGGSSCGSANPSMEVMEMWKRAGNLVQWKQR